MTLCDPMDFSRRKYWSGLPFPFPGSLPDPGIKPRSLALYLDSLPSELPGNPLIVKLFIINSVFLSVVLTASSVKILCVSVIFSGCPKLFHLSFYPALILFIFNYYTFIIFQDLCQDRSLLLFMIFRNGWTVFGS